MSFRKIILPFVTIFVLASAVLLFVGLAPPATSAAVAPATPAAAAKPNATSSPVVGSPWAVKLPGGVVLEMLPVAPGTFLMGSAKDEPGHAAEGGTETQHRVHITKPYWLGKYEVTQAQWQAVMGNNPSNFKGARRPVEQVTSFDALAFCRKLTAQERAAGRLPAGFRYTLPTEAQWEYACRAGTTTPFSTGSNLTTDQANYDGNEPYNGHPKGEDRKRTMDIGSFPANAWGFHDMHGNVWEWCGDWADGYSSESATDPVGNTTGFNASWRIFRGGGWFTYAEGCRSGHRSRNVPHLRFHCLGFRLALSSVGAK
jgi:formylglycine-generating enzyme required for sulfatase activity